MHLLLQKYYFNQELVKLLSDEFASTERGGKNLHHLVLQPHGQKKQS